MILNLALPRLYEKQFSERFMQLFRTFNVQIITSNWDEQESMDRLENRVKEFGRINTANVTVANPNTNEIIFQYIHWDEIEEADRITTDWYSVSYGRNNGFLLYAETSLSTVKQVTDSVRTTLPYLFLLTVAISLVVSVVYAHYLARPIVRISKISRKMSTLDLSDSYEIKRTDEIGELVYNLNDMSEKLEKALIDLQEANIQLQEDMERERKQEKQRGDLFTSISHELKTPMMILKGELEGMIHKVGVYQDRDTYLQQAYERLESMERLVHEILTISQLEMKSIQLSFQKENMSTLVNEVCRKHEILADSRSVAMICFCEEQLYGRADKLQLQSAISNIINNAIFYSQSGEVVHIQLVKSDEMGILTVENSGAHIEEEDLDRLFEPFYRTEKSRNRHTGGSGLGLFIVKSMLDLHQFHYSIHNSEEGVVFKVTFPLI